MEGTEGLFARHSGFYVLKTLLAFFIPVELHTFMSDAVNGCSQDREIGHEVLAQSLRHTYEGQSLLGVLWLLCHLQVVHFVSVGLYPQVGENHSKVFNSGLVKLNFSPPKGETAVFCSLEHFC